MVSRGGGLVVDDHGVHAIEGGQEFGAFVLGEDGAARAFQLADAGVAVEADDEGVAEGAGGFEGLDVAGVEKVEAAVGEDEAPGAPMVAVVAGRGFGEGKDSGRHGNVRHLRAASLTRGVKTASGGRRCSVGPGRDFRYCTMRRFLPYYWATNLRLTKPTE